MPTRQTEKNRKKKTLSRRTSQHSHIESINQLHHLQHMQSRRKRRGRRTHLPDRWTNGWTDGWRASAAVRRCDQIFHIYSRVRSRTSCLRKRRHPRTNGTAGHLRKYPGPLPGGGGACSDPVQSHSAIKGRNWTAGGADGGSGEASPGTRFTEAGRRKRGSATFCKRLPQI